MVDDWCTPVEEIRFEEKGVDAIDNEDLDDFDFDVFGIDGLILRKWFADVKLMLMQSEVFLKSMEQAC